MIGDRLRFAVIGCGMFARSQHIPNLARSAKAALHLCCDVSEETLAGLREQYKVRTMTDYRAAVADPEVEAVCIATTESLRLPVIRAAVEAGKPVYCEKPIGRTLEELYEIQKTIRKSGVPFCAGHNRRSAPALLEAREIFRRHMGDPRPCPWRFDREGDDRPRLTEDGTAGMSVRINDDWYSWKSWVFDKAQAPYGAMLFEMTHFTDMCNWFLAAAPESVVAMESGMLNHGTVIRYRTGEMATIMMASNGTFGYPKELYEIFGNGGAVIVQHLLELRTAGIEGASLYKVFPVLGDRHPDIGTELGLSGWLKKKEAACREAAEKGDNRLIFTAEPDRGHARAIDRFVDQIRGEGPVVCGIDDAVLATRVAFAAVRSAREGRVVRMEEI
jgi:predicted dehydrogenase